VVHDEISGEQYHWAQTNYIRLDPAHAVAHIIALPPVPHHARAALAYRRGFR
jgi:starch synthase (maltosyl-transferring)